MHAAGVNARSSTRHFHRSGISPTFCVSICEVETNLLHKYVLKKEARKLSRAACEKYTLKGVFSYGENSTNATYKKPARTFINWATKKHPNVRTLEQTRKYVAEFLRDNINRGVSASTMHTRAYALACVFDCDVKDFGVNLSERKSADNKRNQEYPLNGWFAPSPGRAYYQQAS